MNYKLYFRKKVRENNMDGYVLKDSEAVIYTD